MGACKRIGINWASFFNKCRLEIADPPCLTEAMTFPATDTVVTYPSGATTSAGTVLHVEPLDGGRLGVVLDVTACHPVDAAWPDQGADRATLSVNGSSYDIVDCVVGATDGSALYLGADVPVRKGTEGWAFVVVHIIEADAARLVEASPAQIVVDPAYRHALSIGHTACHLASLALNAALAGAWTKEVTADAYGSPNFDALAIETSTIGENRSVDIYRLGKSLRKKGFTPAALTDDVAAITTTIDARLAGWVASGASATIATEGDELTSRRYWQTELDGIAVSIPCGGTHATTLSEFDSVTVGLEVEDTGTAVEVRMTTEAALVHPNR